MIIKFIRLTILFFGFYTCFLFVKFIGLFLVKKSKKVNKKILYLSPIFPENAGYIYRSQKWAETLEQEGLETVVKYTLTKDQHTDYLKNNDVRFYLITLYKRTWQVLTSYKYDVVVVNREILLFNDYGNLFMEKLLLKIHPDAILDFDDASSYEKGEPREITSIFGKLMLENGSRFMTSFGLYKNFIAASNYLKEYAQEINPQIPDRNICIIPMCVDYEDYPQKKYDVTSDKPIVLGWLGSNGNLPSLEDIIPSIKEVNKIIPIKLLVISGMEFKQDVDFEIENIQWTYETEVESMLKMDVGLMPLNDTYETVGKSGEKVITKGKGGFKLVQYMGVGIVSIANDTIIERMRMADDVDLVDDGVDGFLIRPQDNWTKILHKALNSRKEFDRVGEMARRKIQASYSFLSNKDRYIKFINKDMD